MKGGKNCTIWVFKICYIGTYVYWHNGSQSMNFGELVLAELCIYNGQSNSENFFHDSGPIDLRIFAKLYEFSWNAL